ncbi:unnamed protein product [Nezara viridula]|uniref:Neuropeptide n=1 Tax=Nezara viridula TaxID=85310 RepID=A0A9P0H3E2_NEZVI|nr:unnamed protein product [Nezara viridula]
MNVFYFILVTFPYFELTLSSPNTPDTQENVTKENSLWTVKSVVIPLLDVGVLWAEDRLVRSKRNLSKRLSKSSVGLMNSIIQQSKNGNQTDSSDAFVDSLVSLMSKSDPALLLKLQKRIEEFEQTRPKTYRNFRAEKPRPLIQFFNVTKISVSSDDDDDIAKSKNVESSVASKNEDDQIVKADPEDNDSEIIAKTDVTTLLKTKDGKIAKIQRSGDKKRYRLEIDCSTKVSSEDVNENEDLQAERKKRKVKLLNQPIVTEKFMGYLKGIVGSSSDDFFVKHSFPLHKGYNINSFT